MSEEIEYTKAIENNIRILAKEFSVNPYNFFSESDVKCWLFMRLYGNHSLSDPRTTIDNKLISPLHSEVSYFNDEGKLLFHVDLSVIDPMTTDVYSTSTTRGIRLSKGYNAGKCYVAIEIKFNKMHNRQKMLELWEKDLSKLENIKTRNALLDCYSILFDKKDHISQETDLAIFSNRYPQIRIVYANASDNVFFVNF